MNRSEYQAIEAQIRTGRQHESNISGIDAALKQELSSISPNQNTLDALYATRRIEQNRRNIAMTRALRMTAAAYQIPAPSGASAHPSNKAEAVSFLPVFDPELLGSYWAYTRGGPVRPRPYDASNDGDIDARTYFNGVSVFRNVPDDPRALALLIIHEAKHAEQFAGQSRLDYAEYRARRASLDAFFQVGFTAADVSLRSKYEEDARKAKAQADYEKTFLGRSELFFHGAAVTLGLAERTEFGITQAQLDHIQAEAQKLRSSVELEESILAEDQRRRMYAPAAPAPPPAGVHMPPPEGLRPDFIAPSAESNADRVRRMIDAACINDWSRADIPSFDRLNGSDLDILRRVASNIGPGCPRSLLLRLIAKRYAGESLTLENLRAEVATISGSASGDIHPDEPRTRGHTGDRGGVTPGDRPSQRGAERRLGNGWKGF